MSAGLAIGLGIESIGAGNRMLSSRDKRTELERRGVNIPWWQQLGQYTLGPLIGSRLEEASLERKLARTEPGLSTRQPVGLSGDAALDQTARFFQQQMARQLGTEIGNINTTFGNIGRFTSGQRGAQVERAQERAGRGFGDFLSRTALERFLQEQRLQTQSDIAMAQIEAQRGGGRTQLFGNILQSGANIFAQNPQGTSDFFRNLFTRRGGNVPTGDPFRFFNPNTADIQIA